MEKPLTPTCDDQPLANLTSEYCSDVAVVIVTFNPNFETLQSTVRAAVGQVRTIFIVDNASSQLPKMWLYDTAKSSDSEIQVIFQEHNIGLGAAYNQGIKLARAQGVKFVLLLDQDSEIASGMVAKLRDAYEKLVSHGLKIAAIGPRYRDSERSAPSLFTRMGLFRFTRTPCTSEEPLVEADFIVSSGSLIPLAALDAIGDMDEALFIDHVDTEWCFRAKSKGFHIYGVCPAIMNHCLGERRMRVWFFRWRIVPFHAAFRYYYIFRNSTLLYRRDYMPLNWKIADMTRCLTFVIFFGICASNRLANLKMMWRGIQDGLKGVAGKFIDYDSPRVIS